MKQGENMYKVIIVDDEYVIRQGLESMVRWQDFGCEVAGTASDGREGVELIEKVKPDIIFTDIKMHNMSGLEMLEIVKKANAHCKMIIITGYRDFEYAQKAISLGVFAFILKPTELDDINKTLKLAVEELDADKARQRIMDEDSDAIIFEKYFYDFLSGIKTVSDKDRQRIDAAYGKIESYTLILVENDLQDSGDTAADNRLLYRYEVAEVVKNCFESSYILSIPVNNLRIAFMVRGGNPVFDKCYRFKSIIENNFGFSVSVGISSAGADIAELPMKYAECEKALEQKAYAGPGAVISAFDAEMFFRYDDFMALNELREKVIEAAGKADAETAAKLSDEIYSYISRISKEINRDIRDYYWSVTVAVDNMVYDGEKEAESNEVFEKINSCGTLSELNEYLKLIIDRTVRTLKENTRSAVDPKVVEIKKYIEANYKKPIKLADIGKHIYVSPYYVSRIFKRDVGMTISEYINIVRIQKAKELLGDVRNRVYEISEMVGIEDAHYFSKLFKKMTGYSPKEYRIMCLESEEE